MRLLINYFSFTVNVADNISLQQQIAQLKERLRHAKMLSQERLRDIASLKQSFDRVLQSSSNFQYRANPRVHLGRGTLWQENKQLGPYSNVIRKEGEFESLDLQLPALHHYLPHLIKNFDGLQPALKIASSRTGGKSYLIKMSIRNLMINYEACFN